MSRVVTIAAAAVVLAVTAVGGPVLLQRADDTAAPAAQRVARHTASASAAPAAAAPPASDAPRSAGQDATPHRARRSDTPRARSDIAPGAKPEPAPDVTPETDAAVVTPPPAAAERDIDPETASAVVARYADAVDALTPDTAAAAVEQVVTGAALQEVEAQVMELEANGWTVQGVTRVSRVRVLTADLDAAEPTAHVQACVDSSDVRLLDESGEPLPQDPHAARRALNIYDLAYLDGAWRVTAHGFPDDTRC